MLSQQPATSTIHPAMHPSSGREVEVTLTAAPLSWEISDSRSVSGWGYNGSVPGPVIHAQAGDTLVVHLHNQLPEPTTIHWHGLRLPAAMDGTEHVQQVIPPGTSFTYRFPLPDAGTFWYHPHTNETVQLERGLYGMLVVHAADGIAVEQERFIALDDLRLDRQGEIAPPGGFLERHNGREGNVNLMNGRSDAELPMRAGTVERWRVLNASSSRYIRLALGGRLFRVIGSDGGLLERGVEMSEVLLAPADRVELLVGPFQDGETIAVESLPYNRGVGRGKVHRYGSVIVRAVGDVAKPSVVPEKLRDIPRLAEPNATATHTVTLSGRLSLRRGVDFLVNGEMHHRAAPVRAGELQIWEIVNASPIDHPFHLHGFFFQVIEVNGVAPAYRSWEDTVNVPAKGRVKIAWVPDYRPGEWMYHCHILEHHASGMMAHLQVVGSDG